MRQFDNDDTDYDALKQSRADDRQSIRELKDAFSLNVGSNPDRLLAILQGTYKPPSIPGEPERITREVNPGDFQRGVSRKVTMADLEEREGGGVRRRGRVNEQYDDGVDEEIGYRQAAAPRAAAVSKYAEVAQALDRFTFSDDPERRKKQMNIVVASIRSALQELVLEDVAVNTKRAFKNYAEKVVKTPGGLKVYFNFNGNKLAVVAKGTFYGDETICVHQAGGTIKAAVLRIEDGNHTDLSSTFEVTVGKVQ